MKPFSGMRSPAIIERSVDFPQPEGPTMATNSPLFRIKEMPFMEEFLRPDCGKHSEYS